MKETKPGRLKRRIFNSWITSLVSIVLVLVMLGTLGIVLINASHLSEYLREKIGFTIVLKDDTREVEVSQLQKILSAGEFLKSSRYIDKETAARELTDNLGEDFTGFLGYNPLFASLEINLYAQYTHPDSLKMLERKLMGYPQVKEIYYQENLVTSINQNVRKISIFLLILSGLLAFIFVVLINNTIRISVYAQRFTINTMQMVGATNAFIRKPFLQKSFFLGIYGALIANGILFLIIASYKKELQFIISNFEIYYLGAVFLMVFLFGIIISSLSTYFAVNKFLRLKFDELF
jgi:cell division transport system permease protein